MGVPCLAFWLVGGLVLEGFHGFKTAAYLDDPLRREMWSLAHAHGTLLAAVGLLMVLLIPRLDLPGWRATWSDRLFAAGMVLLPAGFFLGGLWHGEADPGQGILLVPAGGLMCAAGLALLLGAGRKEGG